MPDGLHPSSKKFFVIEISHTSSLGNSDTDFSNVKHWQVDGEGNFISEPVVAYMPNGRLGALKGGLLHVSDFRKPLSKSDVQSIAMQEVSRKLQQKRT